MNLKEDADWQQKLDLIVHQFTKHYDSLKSSSFSRRENSVSQETSMFSVSTKSNTQ